ncbi:MAG: carbohydrate kinase family protein [Candidatus Peregrinibacteria bacterium]
MKNIIVAGSIAYDNIMFFDGEFDNVLIPENLRHLSVSFKTESVDTYFGGCAPNIAYTLKMLGEKPLIFGAAGNDFDKYKKWLKKNDISTKYIAIDPEKPTSSAYILNDKNQNQISIFSPGAAANLELCRTLDSFDLKTVQLAIIAPDIPDRMTSLTQICIEKEFPYVFDPGQAITALSKDYLSMMIKCCLGLITNTYEAKMLEEKLDMTIEQIAERAGFLIKTLGEGGCQIYQGNTRKIVPAVPGLKIVDVTGCGDAFRAGFIHGFVNGEVMEKCCQMANTAASFVVNNMGTQEHRFTYDDFRGRLKEFYG